MVNSSERKAFGKKAQEAKEAGNIREQAFLKFWQS